MFGFFLRVTDMAEEMTYLGLRFFVYLLKCGSSNKPVEDLVALQ